MISLENRFKKQARKEQMAYSNTKITTKKEPCNAEILNVPIFSNHRDEVLKTIEAWVESGETKKRISLVFTPNPEMLVEAKHDKSFENVLRQGDLNIPDGVGLVIAGRILDQNVSASLAGTDLGHDLFMIAAEKGWRVYLLGARLGIAQKAGQMLEIEAKESGRKVHQKFAWKADSGPTFTVGHGEGKTEKEIVADINNFKPDLLFIAFGHKRQESWLVAHREVLKAKVGFGIGGAFDFWSGAIKRAPVWVRKLGFEWFYRLIQEPWRWRRQLRLIEFGWLVFREKFTKKG